MPAGTNMHATGAKLSAIPHIIIDTHAHSEVIKCHQHHACTHTHTICINITHTHNITLSRPKKPAIRQKQENKQRSFIRYIVERTFGLLKQHHGLAKARYLGLERNKTRAQLIAMSHNLKTGMNIFKQMRSLGDCYAQ
ncbi:transposase [Bathymodiolus thermophilus thioautotrophic gill symbiont]|nr:transposase [Bathymodiolus thermophilus thioautotrophic gill symbiont]